ncbi:hypothetical protein SK128_028252 [Halocaridina rubra]|uniref:Protein NATD1 n=1 Tax=Halocaridina rubra TaxID=373956 RepID=A0AAN8XNY0_HALRR
MSQNECWSLYYQVYIPRTESRAALGIRLKSGEVPEGMQVHHDQENKEFYISLGNEKAFLQYDIIDEEAGLVDLQHTVVPDAYRGQGIAKVLAKIAA